MSAIRAEERIRVLVAKPGLDGHDRGAKVVAGALRDAGMEVIYAGIHQTPQMIAEAAIQEDVDVVGLSIHSGAHMTLIPKVMEALVAAGKNDAIVVVGGIVPKEDVRALGELGISRVYTPGAPIAEIIEFLKTAVAQKRAGTAGS